MSLVGSGNVDKGAIISAAGDSAWATSAGFTACCEQISAEEMKNIASIVNGDQASIEKAHAEGIHVGGERFVVARIDEGNIYGRKGRCGVVISKSKQAILVGHHGEAQQPGNTTKTVEGLKDYLFGLGY
ncbi:Profilin [Cytospora mali]|uniref:Profilin n=1 Tax=Cytospora mali TaxID=578113 RepID=A0A194VWJ6_CYTMA|nr:Profilin [Valsa mali]